MLFLLDTNALSQFLRGHANVIAKVRDVRADGAAVGTTAITIGEMQYGIERMGDGWRRRELEVKFARFQIELPCFDVTSEVGDIYGPLRAKQEQIGFRLADNDLWIAAAAASMMRLSSAMTATLGASKAYAWKTGSHDSMADTREEGFQVCTIGGTP